MTRSKVKVTQDMLDEVEKMAARGLDYAQIAYCLGTSISTLRRRRKVNENLEDAIQRGRAKGILQVSNALFKKAIKGDTTAMIFYLKSRDPEKWNEKHHLQISGGIEVAAMSEEAAQELLERFRCEPAESILDIAPHSARVSLGLTVSEEPTNGNGNRGGNHA